MTAAERKQYFTESGEGAALIMVWEVLGSRYVLGRISSWLFGGSEVLTASQMGKIIGWG